MEFSFPGYEWPQSISMDETARLTLADGTSRPREEILHDQPEQYLEHNSAWVEQFWRGCED